MNYIYGYGDLNSDFVLKDCLFGVAMLAKNTLVNISSLLVIFLFCFFLLLGNETVILANINFEFLFIVFHHRGSNLYFITF